jgi:hypothetical protein
MGRAVSSRMNAKAAKEVCRGSWAWDRAATATAQRAPDQQRQQQGEDAGQHHDDARNVRIQDMGDP